jgi:hypothetical protein
VWRAGCPAMDALGSGDWTPGPMFHSASSGARTTGQGMLVKIESEAAGRRQLWGALEGAGDSMGVRCTPLPDSTGAVRIGYYANCPRHFGELSFHSVGRCYPGRVKTDQCIVVTGESPSGQVIRVAYSRPSEVELAVASFKRSGYRILEIAPKDGVVVRRIG